MLLVIDKYSQVAKLAASATKFSHGAADGRPQGKRIGEKFEVFRPDLTRRKKKTQTFYWFFSRSVKIQNSKFGISTKKSSYGQSMRKNILYRLN